MTKEELKSYLYENYHHTAERIFKNKFPKEYLKIKNIEFPEDFSFVQKIYHYINNDIDLNFGLCPVCGKRCGFKRLKSGYYIYCSLKCSGIDKNTGEKRKKTVNEKYGVDNVSQLEEVKKRVRKTSLLHYGVENPSQTESIKKKKSKTTYLHYGVENPSQAESIKKKKEETCFKNYGVKYPFQSEKIQNKSKETNTIKIGVPYSMQSEEVKEKSRKTNLEKYGVEYPMQSEEIKEKSKKTCMDKYGVCYSSQSDITKEHIKQTCLEKYGVEWYCMTKDCRSNSSNDSKPNREFAKLLDDNHIGYEREFHLENYSYDFKINDILIEINPTITHNSYLNVFGNEPMSKDYHINKTACANKNDYHCIHIWDWDNLYKIINTLKPKKTLYARNLELKEVSEKECNEFLNLYHFQNTCKGQTICIGLYKDDILVQTMTLGKPRYNKNYELELLRLCSHKDYKIVGGAERLFKYILDKYKPKSIISYCNVSKFNGDVYIRLGFKLKNISGPSKHWYSTKTRQHITDNLLRQRGFDQLFNTKYGKGTSNEELMLEHGFLPVYDCGQITWVYK